MDKLALVTLLYVLVVIALAGVPLVVVASGVGQRHADKVIAGLEPEAWGLFELGRAVG